MLLHEWQIYVEYTIFEYLKLIEYLKNRMKDLMLLHEWQIDVEYTIFEYLKLFEYLKNRMKDLMLLDEWQILENHIRLHMPEISKKVKP